MPIGEIILHLGMHKTGTTSIQQALAGYDDGSVAYADLRISEHQDPNHGPAVETLYRTELERIPVHRQLGRSRAEIEALIPRFRKQLTSALAMERDRLVLSGEGIPRLNREELKQLLALLRSSAKTIRAIVYVREPLGFCSAMLQQQLKTAKLPPASPIPLPRYRRKFAKFRRLLGPEFITFRPYARTQFPNGSVVEDFCNLIGIAPPETPVDQNVGLSAEATRALFLLAEAPEIVCNSVAARRALIDVQHVIAKALPGPSFRLPAGYVAAHVPVEDVEWMEHVAGFSLGLEAEPERESRSLAEAVGTLGATAIRKLDALAGLSGGDPHAAVTALYTRAFESARRLQPTRETVNRLRFAFGRG